MAHGLQLFAPHDRESQMVLQPHPDEGQRVRGVGTIRISDDFTLREVALVDKLGFNLLSVS